MYKSCLDRARRLFRRKVTAIYLNFSWVNCLVKESVIHPVVYRGVVLGKKKIMQVDFAEESEKIKVDFAFDVMTDILHLEGHRSERNSTFDHLYPYDMQRAIFYLHMRIKDNVLDEYLRIKESEEVSLNSFLSVARRLRTACFRLGFEALKFLKFIICVCSMAVRFYEEGVEEAIYCAVAFISNSMSFNMENGGWDALYLKAKALCTTAIAVTDETPDSSIGGTDASSDGYTPVMSENEFPETPESDDGVA